MNKQSAAAGLEVSDVFSFGESYAETLKRWRLKFLEEVEKVTDLGFGQDFQEALALLLHLL